MTPNFIGPYWTQINYHGALAPHTMTLPCKNWSSGTGTGTFDTWSGTPIVAQTMIEALVDVFLPLVNADVVFDNWTIFKQLLPTDDIQPVMSKALTGKVGTNTGASWSGAVQMQFIARTAAFGLAKLNILDAASENDFNPITVFSGAIAGVYGEWGLDANGWAGRDNAQVTIPLKVTLNINQKLRKEYRLD